MTERVALLIGRSTATLRAVLESSGYKVFAARSPKDARAVIKKVGDRCSLAVLDVHAEELTPWLKVRCPFAKILISSSDLDALSNTLFPPSARSRLSILRSFP